MHSDVPEYDAVSWVTEL